MNQLMNMSETQAAINRGEDVRTAEEKKISLPEILNMAYSMNSQSASSSGMTSETPENDRQHLSGISKSLKSIQQLQTLASYMTEKSLEVESRDPPDYLQQIESNLELQLATLHTKQQELYTARANLQRRSEELGQDGLASRLAFLNISQAEYDGLQISVPQQLKQVRDLRRMVSLMNPQAPQSELPLSDPVLQAILEVFEEREGDDPTRRARESCSQMSAFAQKNPGQVLSEQNVIGLTVLSEKLAGAMALVADQSNSLDFDQAQAVLKSIREAARDAAATLDMTNLTSPLVKAAMEADGLSQEPDHSIFEMVNRLKALLSLALQNVAQNFNDMGHHRTANSLSQSNALQTQELEEMYTGAQEVSDAIRSVQNEPIELTREPYEYQNLSTPTCIRFIYIRGNKNGVIHCSLKEYDLNSQPRKGFIALSYVWADHRAPFLAGYHTEKALREYPIICNGRKMLVTSNLHTALHELAARDTSVRARKERVRYWVDQLCINQSNLSEKNVQVGMMEKIYKSASRVFAWLGPSDKFSAEACKLVEQIASIPKSEYSKVGYDVQTMVQNIPQSEWQSLSAMLSRSYFSRAWIVQELLLAHKIQLLCGSHTLSWKHMVQCSRFIGKTKAWRLLSDYSKRVAKPTAALSPGTSFIEQCRGLVAVRDRFQKRTVLLDEVLFLGRQFGATNPRDNAFAMLGLVKETLGDYDSQYLPKADYAKSVKEVYHDFGVFFFRSTPDLRLLSYIEDEGCRSYKSLPSWVPDLSTQLWPRPLQVQHGNIEPWDAAKYLDPGNLTPSIDNCILTLCGVRIDTIRAIAEPFDNDGFWRSAFALLKCIRDSGGHVPRPDVALMKTLVADPAAYLAGGDYVGNGLGRDFVWWIVDALRRLNPDASHGDESTTMEQSLLDHLARATGMMENVVEDVHVDKASALRALLSDYGTYESPFIRWHANNMKAKETSDSHQLYRSTIRALAALTDLDPTSLLPNPKYFGPLFQALNGPDRPEKTEMTAAIARFETAVGVNTQQRRLFRTARYYLGMGPLSLQEGDSIWALSGAKVPLILRRLDPGHYQVVGEAYVYGVMHGEAVRDTSCLQVIKLGNEADNQLVTQLLPW